MSWWRFAKFILLLLLVGCLGFFIYLEIQLMGNPGSQFNQTTRFVLGKRPAFRAFFKLNNYGDARAEYFSAKGPINIIWFKSQTENLDPEVLQKFADKVSSYTGRPTLVQYGGDIGDGVEDTASFPAFEIKPQAKVSSGSKLFVFFTKDYTPRQPHELSSTYQESGIVMSLDANQQFVQGHESQLDDYLLSSLLHEFGHQLGLEHNTETGCIMNPHAGIEYQPSEIFGQTTPQDYCPFEQGQINTIRLQFQNN